MELTSPVLAWTLTGATALVVVATVATWRRLARTGPVTVLARCGVLLLVNVLLLSTVVVRVNDEFGFFASWDDLLGGAGATSTTTSAGGPRPTTPAADGPRTAPVVVPGYGGRVLQVRVPGPRSGVEGTALLVLPADYGTAAAATRHYPVLEALHGYPGTPGQWLDAMDVIHSLDATAAAGRVSEALVVVPDLAQPAGRDTECVDGGPGDPALETWLAQDVPDWVASHYRTAVGPSSWSTMGFSMGGWCASMLSLLHPGRFGAAVSFGGYFTLDLGGWRPWAVDSPQARRYDLLSLVRQYAPDVDLWAMTSPGDGLSWPSTEAAARAAHGGTSVTVVQQQQTGHRTSIWAAQVPAALTWLGATAAGFAPPPVPTSRG